MFAMVFLPNPTSFLWRMYCIACAAPGLFAIVILVYFYVPESARFLALHGQHDKALEVANYLARTM
jgi:hypothetical protein